ncbi:hypothetical protein [Nocardia brevicatena]|nr:hypothetical protein [Nocardia brevicatena]
MKKLDELTALNLEQLMADASPALRAAIERYLAPAGRGHFGFQAFIDLGS